MEFVEGVNAQQWMQKRGILGVKQGVAVIAQLLTALDYAHAKNFVHRDIKPANLLIEKHQGSFRVKLSDFGLARVYQASKLSGLTLHGEMGGSMGFMAPEQITASTQVDGRADVYALGATLFQLLTKRTPCGDRSAGTPGADSVDQRLDANPANVVAALAAAEYDGVKYPDILQDLLAMASGNIVEDPVGTFTVYERDGATPRYVFKKIDNKRLRQ